MLQMHNYSVLNLTDRCWNFARNEIRSFLSESKVYLNEANQPPTFYRIFALCLAVYHCPHLKDSVVPWNMKAISKVVKGRWLRCG